MNIFEDKINYVMDTFSELGIDAKKLGIKERVLKFMAECIVRRLAYKFEEDYKRLDAMIKAEAEQHKAIMREREEQERWKRCVMRNTITEYEFFCTLNPDSKFVDTAQKNIERLERQENAGHIAPKTRKC